jgi:hypothetical protein
VRNQGESSVAQKGQAMVFGLLFLAVVLMALLALFNQGQLVNHRVQLENTADASVYSQAKLAARNQNFIAYTNRAMVANEVSIGQMVALLSWAKHYRDVGAFTSYPLYRFPVAPPSPTTFSDVLQTVTIPYAVMGNVVSVAAKFMVETWPTVVSYFNSALGVFQKIFAVATLAAQVEVNLRVVKDHERDPERPQMYIPAIGWYFFTQNTLLTYFGENFSPTNLKSLARNAMSDEESADEAEALAEDFLASQVGELENMINDNSPGLGKKKAKNTSGGAGSNMNTGENAEAQAVEAYKRYAAIVNRNRESFTKDRHWSLFPYVDVPIPELKLSLGIITLTIDLDLGFGAGLKNDGGTVYQANSEISSDADIAKLGWHSIDVTSFGVQFDIGLYVNIELCLPIIGCNDWTLLDIDFSLPIGFPLAGATHQVVSDNLHAKKFLPEWGFPFTNDTGRYGGDPDSPVNNGAFDGFHAQALFWGQASPSLAPGMYGARTSADVTDSYAGPPSFFSLGSNFQQTGRSYEFTIAVAKSLNDVKTSDSNTFNIRGESSDWDDPDSELHFTRFDAETHSRAEGTDFAAAYQRFVWGDGRPMMTISSAETYFSNPMQKTADGGAEPASLFSPFWDARLRQPSKIAYLIATGDIDFRELFEGLGSTALGMIDWLLRAIGEKLVQSGIDYLLEQIGPPWGSFVEDPIRDAGSQVVDFTVDAVIGELEEFLP